MGALLINEHKATLELMEDIGIVNLVRGTGLGVGEQLFTGILIAPVGADSEGVGFCGSVQLFPARGHGSGRFTLTCTT